MSFFPHNTFSYSHFIQWWLNPSWSRLAKLIQSPWIQGDLNGQGSFSEVISLKVSGTWPSNSELYNPYLGKVSSNVLTDFSRSGPYVITSQLWSFEAFQPLQHTAMCQMWLFHCLLPRVSLISFCFSIANDISPSLFYILPESNLKCIGPIYSF